MLSLVCTLLMTTVAAPPAEATAPTKSADVVVVCPAPFEDALKPWLEYRRAQGHVVEVVPAIEAAEKIKARLHEAFKAEPKLSIVLIGDVEDRSAFNPAARTFAVPTHYAQAKINVLFGSEPTIATDNWYADFDDDGVPEAAVGRLPVDSAAELDKLTKRIIAYERSTDFGQWRRKINFVAGIGGFGYLADTAIESAAKSLLVAHLPPEYESTMTYASWRSPYFPGAKEFHDATVERFNEGCLMWVYIGHGGVRELDRFKTPDDKVHRIFDAGDVGKLQAWQPPIALFLSCYSVAFDARVDCLGEEMLRSEGGPIAVLGGSRVTMPYAMSILGQELMTTFFKGRAATVGQLLRDAKRGLALKPRTSDADKLFDAVAAAMMPMAADLKAQRVEHAQLFNLLGDPLLRLKHPEPILVRTPDERDIAARKDSPEQIVEPLVFDRDGVAQVVDQPHRTDPPAVAHFAAVERRFEGKLQLEVAARRDRLRWPIADRVKYDPAFDYQSDYKRTLHSLYEVYEEFDDLWTWIAPRFPTPGDYCIRAYVAGKNSFAMGAGQVRVVPAKAKPVATLQAEKPKTP